MEHTTYIHSTSTHLQKEISTKSSCFCFYTITDTDCISTIIYNTTILHNINNVICMLLVEYVRHLHFLISINGETLVISWIDNLICI